MVGTVATKPVASGCDQFDHAIVRMQAKPKVNIILPIL
jgi:hypothetical protein